MSGPKFDTELEPKVAEFTVPSNLLSPEVLEALKSASQADLENAIGGYAIESQDVYVRTTNANILLTILRRAAPTRSGPKPAMLFFHGGGLLLGNRFSDIQHILWAVDELDVLCVTVEYRLAPANPYPAALEDCYAAFLWVYENADMLGVHPKKIMLVGSSAGGGLAAALSFYTRDRGGPSAYAQFLICPMLDDRAKTLSNEQFSEHGIWNRNHNIASWKSYLHDRYGTHELEPYAAPARATDFARLPLTYIDVGSSEVFRDEVVEFATNIWAAGGDAELHVWSGGWHNFDLLAPTARISIAARQTKASWIKRVVAHQDESEDYLFVSSENTI